MGISSLKSVKSYGCYYLLNDVTTTDEGWGSDLDDVRICLNGHNIILENGYYRPYIHVTNYHTLTITDCAQEAGQITRKDTADPKGTCIIEIDAGCKFNMFGGEITGFKMRCRQSKLTTIKAFQSIGYDTIASGDSYNDLGMIRASKAGFLFKSTDQIKNDNPDLPAYETYEELLAAIKAAV